MTTITETLPAEQNLQDWFLVHGDTLTGEDERLEGIPPEGEPLARLARYIHEVDDNGRPAIRMLPRRPAKATKLGFLLAPNYVIEYWEARLVGKRMVGEHERSSENVSCRINGMVMDC